MAESRKPVVGVMGGGSVDAEVERLAFALGRAIATRGWVLLTGGRDCGVMAAAVRGAKQGGGVAVGILPGRDREGACPGLDVAVVTGMGDARNVINVLTSDVVIALTGGAGTASEVALALKSGRRVILLGFPVWPALDSYRAVGLLTSANSVEDAVTQAEAVLTEHG